MLNCIGKLFTSILNTRLKNRSGKKNIFLEEQCGFRENRRTVDCIFILNTLIEKTRGLAEMCSHVGSVLYWTETAVRIRDKATCVHMFVLCCTGQKLLCVSEIRLHALPKNVWFDANPCL